MSDRSYIYLVEPSRDPALMGWQAALAGRASARANVVLIGPSTVEGYPTTDFSLTPAQQLARALRAKFPTPGLGSSGGRGRIGVPSQGISPSLPSPLAFTGGAFDPSSYSLIPSLHNGASHTCWYATASGAKVVFQLKNYETSFDIVQKAGPAGHATAGYYKINGGASVPFSTLAGSNAINVVHVNVATEGAEEGSIDGGSPLSGATIEIGCSGSGTLVLSEIITYGGDESSGIMVHGVGHAGYASSNWALGYTTTGGWRNAIANLAPNVIVIEAGMNDAAANSAATFQTNLQTFISAIRSVGGSTIPTCPILITAPYDAESASVYVDPWADYVAAMRVVADSDPLIAFCNEGDRMPATGDLATFGLYHSDKMHSNANGKAYSMQAHIVAEALSFG